MRPVVHSQKHYVQQSLATVTGGTNNQIFIAKTVAVSSTNADEVIEGAIIKAVFVEMWIRSTEASPGTVLVSLVKTPDNSNFTFADSVALDGYTNKKNILYHTQGLTNDNSADAIPFVRGWYKIPKTKQRFGLGDRLVLNISSQAIIDNIICGFMIYKEYT